MDCPYEAFGDVGVSFIVNLESTTIHEPRPCSLDDPALRENHELVRMDALDDLGVHTATLAVLDERGLEPAVAPQLLEPFRLCPAGIEHLSLAASLQSAIQRHTRRTGTQVEAGISGLEFTVTPALNTCLYRFVQEGLNNAFRHAAGKGQTVDAYQSGQTIEVCISDCGPGLSEPGEGAFGYKQGLIFMRDRIQSLGGQLDIWSRPGQGVRLTARFTMTQEDQDARNNTSA